MNTEQARQAAIASGYQGEPTAAVLRMFGWAPTDWSAEATVNPSPVDTATARQAGDAAVAAAAAANAPAQVISTIEKLAVLALKAAGMIVCIMLMIGVAPGCKSAGSEQAVVVTNTQALLANYQANTSSLVQAMISGYRAEQRAVVDQLAADAIAAETGADGKANGKNIQVIQAKRLAQYVAIDEVCATISSKWAAINQDAANASVGLAALQQSFQSSADTSQAYQQASDAALALLQQVLAGKSTKSTSPIVTAVRGVK